MKMKLMLGAAVLGLSLPAMANQDFVPYVGADVKWNNMEFKKETGTNLFQKNYPQGNLFGGVKFNEWVALELGYERTAQKSKTGSVDVGTPFFGTTNILLDALSTKTKTKISGFNFNVVGLYPLFEEYCLSLFGSVGLAQLKLKSRFDFSVPTDPTVLHRDFSKRKVVPRVTLGVQHMLNDNIGIRAMLAWERTSSFKKVYSNTPGAILYMSPKDSKSIGLGVFYSFK